MAALNCKLNSVIPFIEMKSLAKKLSSKKLFKMNFFTFAPLLLTLATVAHASVKSSPIIKTTSGSIIGDTVQLDTNAQVDRFLGVPYAQAPLGENRFEKPQPIVNQSESILMAQQPKPTCIQMHHLSQAISPLLDLDQLHNISEDCLYLNIYIPANAQNSNLPVMVWLPGEGFDFADARQFNAGYLASLGQVIVITVQYRVGVFGFLKNNAGLWDQLLALKWINENVRSMGGDPENVTLFGRFTGSMSISILLSSPQTIKSATPLFNRAILMSGIAVGNWVFDKQHDDKVQQVLHDADCADLNCLKSLDGEQLLAKSGYGWKPFIDSELINEEPLVALRKGHFPKYVTDVMLGTNQFEGNLCMLKHLVTDPAFYEKLINNNVSTADYDKAIREDLLMFYGNEESIQNSERGLVKDRSMYVEFCSELLINSHMRQYGQLLHSIAKRTDNALQSVVDYKLDYKPSFSIAPEFITSSIHGDDVLLGFGLAFKNNQQVTHNDREISNQMVSLFSNFAQIGMPKNAKYVEIKLESATGHFVWQFTNWQLLALVACFMLLLCLAVIVLLTIKLARHHSPEHVKHLIHSDVY